MRVAYIAAGAAGMYCGTCIHDNTLATALQAAGHEVALLPLYTPLRTDEDSVSMRQIFYGAVNVYLQQKSSFFRHTPRALDKLLDRPALLNRLSGLAASTDARDLGDLTLEVLRAKDGKQKKELSRLLEWFQDFQPDVVQVANSMLLGIAADIKEAIDVPIVCSLTGEDIFLDELPEPQRSRVTDEMRRRAQDADAFIATSRYYADAMTEFLGIDPEVMHVVHLGINLDFIGTGHDTRQPADSLTIGYMARICPEKGLHLLLDAFHHVVQLRPDLDVTAQIAGYVGARDREYLQEQKTKVREWGLEDRITILGEVDLEGKRHLLRSADVVSVPTIYQEPKGLFVLEALAHGVPVIQPAHGAFPELIESTGGGLLVEPDSVEALATGLITLLDDEDRRLELGASGSRSIRGEFDSTTMAARTAEIYSAVREKNGVQRGA